MMSFYPPINFNQVEDNLYRSGIPTEVNFEFLKHLQLKTVILLDYIDEKSIQFFETNNAQIFYFENSVHEELRSLHPVAEEMVTNALKIITNKQETPTIIMCKTGRNLTGVVVSCLRKLQNWSFISIYEEYRRFAGSRRQQQYEQFIELYDTDLIKLSNEDVPDFIIRSRKP